MINDSFKSTVLNEIMRVISKTELLSYISSLPKTGLFEKGDDRQRVQLFVKYVRNFIHIKDNNPYKDLNRIFETKLTESKQSGEWLIKILMNNEKTYDKTYFENLCQNYQKETVDSKAGPIYKRFKQIEKSTELPFESVIESNLYEHLKSKFDSEELDQKLKQIITDRNKKIEEHNFLVKHKSIRLNELAFALKYDKQYQRWTRLKKIWEKHNFEEINEKLTETKTAKSQKNQVSGNKFERKVLDSIKTIFEKSQIITNIEIKIDKNVLGEIDMVVLNKDKITAIVEIKKNIHDINHGFIQLNRIKQLLTDRKDELTLEQKLTVNHNSVSYCMHRIKRFKTDFDSPNQNHLLNKINPETKYIVITSIHSDLTTDVGVPFNVVKSISKCLKSDSEFMKIVKSNSDLDDKSVITKILQIMKHVNNESNFVDLELLVETYGDRLIVAEFSNVQREFSLKRPRNLD